MDCQEVQANILESLGEPFRAERRRAMEDHMAACETCRGFNALQRMLDARLAAAMPPACLSAGFRKSLRKRIRRDLAAAWPDFLPELAHLAGGLVAIGVSVFLLPLPARTVILAGAACIGLTYFLQTVVRNSLDGLEGDV